MIRMMFGLRNPAEESGTAHPTHLLVSALYCAGRELPRFVLVFSHAPSTRGIKNRIFPHYDALVVRGFPSAKRGSPSAGDHVPMRILDGSK